MYQFLWAYHTQNVQNVHSAISVVLGWLVSYSSYGWTVTIWIDISICHLAWWGGLNQDYIVLDGGWGPLKIEGLVPTSQFLLTLTELKVLYIYCIYSNIGVVLYGLFSWSVFHNFGDLQWPWNPRTSEALISRYLNKLCWKGLFFVLCLKQCSLEICWATYDITAKRSRWNKLILLFDLHN